MSQQINRHAADRVSRRDRESDPRISEDYYIISFCTRCFEMNGRCKKPFFSEMTIIIIELKCYSKSFNVTDDSFNSHLIQDSFS